MCVFLLFWVSNLNTVKLDVLYGMFVPSFLYWFFFMGFEPFKCIGGHSVI